MKWITKIDDDDDDDDDEWISNQKLSALKLNRQSIFFPLIVKGTFFSSIVVRNVAPWIFYLNFLKFKFSIILFVICYSPKTKNFTNSFTKSKKLLISFPHKLTNSMRKFTSSHNSIQTYMSLWRIMRACEYIQKLMWFFTNTLIMRACEFVSLWRIGL